MLHVLKPLVTTIPTSLFHEDGAMRKTYKTELTHILESKVPATDGDDQLIIDINTSVWPSYKDVFGQYEHTDFNKIEERKRRLAAACGAKTYQMIDGRLLPPWQRFMALISNKASLKAYSTIY
jgi:hypothetical protein